MNFNTTGTLHECVLCRLPVYEVCPNYEVVEFQLWTVTPPEPRLCRLLLHIYTFPASPSIPTAWCPSGGVIPLLPQHSLYRRPSCLFTGSSAHLGVNCLRPSISIFYASPLSFAVSSSPFQPSLAPTTHDVLLLPSHPCDSPLPTDSTTAPRGSPLPRNLSLSLTRQK